MATNGTTATTTTQAQAKEHPLTDKSGADIVRLYLDALPRPQTEEQEKALALFEAGNYDLCKVFASVYLDDSYIKALGYLSSVPKVTAAGLPTLPTLLSEAARSVADAWAAFNIANNRGTASAEAIRRVQLEELGDLNAAIFKKALEGAA